VATDRIAAAGKKHLSELSQNGSIGEVHPGVVVF
jgi:hypothetical protein